MVFDEDEIYKAFHVRFGWLTMVDNKISFLQTIIRKFDKRNLLQNWPTWTQAIALHNTLI